MSVTTDVFLTNAVRTSQGPGPGPKTLPAGEAAALVARKLAVYGSQPPHGFTDGALPPAVLALAQARPPQPPQPPQQPGEGT